MLFVFWGSNKTIKNMMTANLILSPTAFNVGLIVFIILILAVIALRGRKFIEPFINKSNKPKKNNKKGDNKKRDLEIIAEEIKKRNDDCGVNLDY